MLWLGFALGYVGFMATWWAGFAVMEYRRAKRYRRAR